MIFFWKRLYAYIYKFVKNMSKIIYIYIYKLFLLLFNSYKNNTFLWIYCYRFIVLNYLELVHLLLCFQLQALE